LTFSGDTNPRSQRYLSQEGSPSRKGFSMKWNWIVLAGMSIGGVAAQDRITVELANAASVPHYVVSRARAMVDFVFERAGFKIDWIETSTGDRTPWIPICKDSTDVSRFAVVIRRDEGSARLHDTVLGYAMPFSGMRNRAAVLWQSVFRAAQENADKVDSGMLLGMVIAHELGHLVMGSGTHGTGVMSANWLRPDFIAIGRRGLRFTPAEMVQLHQGLRNRYRVIDTGTLLLARR
jgi:hypothetical protein